MTRVCAAAARGVAAGHSLGPGVSVGTLWRFGWCRRACDHGLGRWRAISRSTEVMLTTTTIDLDTLSINTIRGLCMDAVQRAESGHPGTPMGIAPVAYALWQRCL